MTDDSARPRPGTPGGADDTRTEAFRWDPDFHTEVARASGGTGASDAEYAEDAVTRAFGWSLAADDDATQTSEWDEEPPPVDSSLDGAPPLDAQPPTEAMAWETGVVPGVAPGGPLPPAADPIPAGLGGIDALFQPGSFRDFEPTPVLSLTPRPVGASAVRGVRTRPSLTAGQRSLLWAAGALVAILVLLALFSIGRRLPALFAAPAPVETAAPTPTPTQQPTAGGSVPPGEYAWDELRGGECLDPYDRAWAEEFTVVDCAEPHAAQLVLRAQFPDEVAPDGAYPGFDELASRISRLCTRPNVVDYAAARAFDDIVVEGAHAVTPEEWDEGYTEYFCFLERSSGEPLTGRLAVPRE